MPPSAPTAHGSYAPVNISSYAGSLFTLSEISAADASKDETSSGVEEEDNDGASTADGAADASDRDYVDELMSDRDRRGQLVVDAFGHIVPEATRRNLWALLSCLYLRHTTVADSVLRGLTSLLKDTNFFEGDLTNVQQPGTLSLLDVTIEAVTDRLDMCREAEFIRVLAFLQVLVKHSGGRLSPISLQRVMKALSFMLHMAATRASWMKEGLPMPLEGHVSGTQREINAFVVLCDLVWAVVAQVETCDAVHFLPPDDSTESIRRTSSAGGVAGIGAEPSATEIAHEFVLDFIEEVIDSVEVSRIAEATQLAISKQSSSTTSSHFWQSISTMSRRLFTDSAYKSAYLTLCVLTKLAWHDIRNMATGNPLPRDLGGKLMALEALLEFCLAAGEKMRGSKIVGYMIRRLVVPCILYNIQFGLRDHRVFAKLMKIITALWKVWRSHVRIEFALLVEQIVIRVLQADMLTIRPVYQMIVIQEVVTWFDQPHLLVEMFVNYDMDRKFVSHWNIFSHLIRAVCTTARRVNIVTGAWDWRPRSDSSDDLNSPHNAVSIRSVHMQALEEVGRISKTLMDATGHAYLIMQDANFRYKTLGAGSGWEEDFVDGDDFAEVGDSSKETGRLSSVRDSTGGNGNGAEHGGTPDLNGGGGRLSQGAAGNKKGGQAATVKFRRAVHQESEELLREAIKIYGEKNSLIKAVRYLVSKNFMADTPQEIASFLRVYKNSLDPSAIGEFLGEGGRNNVEAEYWSQIRFRYTRAVSFVEMDLEPALRLYLTGCGFRLPGESQKVDRFVEVFVKAFWQDNSGTSHCPFSHPDTVHLVTYAIIQLNTDHHRAKLHARSKMTKEQFIRNLRGADKDHDIDRDYLSRIFENVQAEAIELAVEAGEGSSANAHAGGGWAGAGSGGSSGGGSAGSKQQAHRGSSVFPSNDAFSALSLLSFRPTLTSQDLSLQEEQKFFRDVTRTLRDSEDLLRSLSPFTYRFQLTGVDTNISMDLVSFMYETVWFHFRAITDSLLDGQKNKNKSAAVGGRAGSAGSKGGKPGADGRSGSQQTHSGSQQHGSSQQQTTSQQQTNDMYVVFVALDILCYSLTASIFLGLRVEALTFAEQLAKFIKEECSGGGWTADDDEWLDDVKRGSPESAMETIAKVHTLLVRVKDAVQESTNREVTRSVAARIEKKANVLENNGFFVCEGDLAKRNRNRRFVTYRFFLFSDHLIYAHLGLSGEYKVHGQLHLTQMTVTDLPSDQTHCSLYITHPTKSFVVVADSPATKQQWQRDLQQTIQNCNKRVASDPSGRGRKQSFLNRIEAQQKVQLQQKQLAMTNSPTRAGDGGPLRRTSSAGIVVKDDGPQPTELTAPPLPPTLPLSPATPPPNERGLDSSFVLPSGSDASEAGQPYSPPSSPPLPLAPFPSP